MNYSHEKFRQCSPIDADFFHHDAYVAHMFSFRLLIHVCTKLLFILNIEPENKDIYKIHIFCLSLSLKRSLHEDPTHSIIKQLFMV